MKILSVETSCDETAVSLVEAKGGLTEPHFSVLGNSLFSQIDIHKEYGGVFPNLAKREHAKNLVPLLVETLKQARFYSPKNKQETNSEKQTDLEKMWREIESTLSREEGLCALFEKNLKNIEKPEIDVIAVTSGPGLEPALWVGISFALALGKLWAIPVIPANHMEGHIASVLLDPQQLQLQNSVQKAIFCKRVEFPAVAVLISGGHTEIVEMQDWGKYKILGKTRDDAVGEAFDKVARMLGLPYPGGPEISKLAEMARQENLPHICTLPRPMINSKDLDFSFSGLKTAVLYYIKTKGKITDDDKKDIAREFEDSVTEVLVEKTRLALDETGAKTLIVAGGVISNKKLREEFTKLEKEYIGFVVKTPTHDMSTDNAIMIACSTYINTQIYPEILKSQPEIIANGNLKLGIDK